METVEMLNLRIESLIEKHDLWALHIFLQRYVHSDDDDLLTACWKTGSVEKQT